MNKRHQSEILSVCFFVSLTLLLTSCSSGVDDGLSGNAPKNVVLITVGSFRADVLEPCGEGRSIARNVALMAEQSLKFTNCYSHSPETKPSLASLMTGYFPHDVNLLTNEQDLASGIPTLAEVFRNAGYQTAAVVSSSLLARGCGLERGFTTYLDATSGSSVASEISNKRAWQVTREATRLLHKLKGSRFFLWLHYADPYGPYTPPEPYGRMLPSCWLKFPSEPRLRLNQTNSGWLGIPKYQQVGEHRDAASYRMRYASEVALADQYIGEFLKELSSLNLNGDTAIIVTGDHGEGMGEHDCYFNHSEHLYDEFIHVPLAVSVPGFKPEVRDETVGHVDVFETLIAFANADLKGRRRGRNILERPDSPTITFSESYSGGQRRSLIDKHWKIIAPGGLYSMNTDRAEVKNLYGTPEGHTYDELLSRLSDLSAPISISPEVSKSTSPLQTRKPDDIFAVEKNREQIVIPRYYGVWEASLAGIWVRESEPTNPSATLAMKTRQRDASCTVRLTGTRLCIIVKMQPESGSGRIYVDGKEVSLLKGWRGRHFWRDYYAMEIPGEYSNSEHVVTIRYAEERNPYGFPPWLNISGFLSYSLKARHDREPLCLPGTVERVLSLGPPGSDDAGEIRDPSLVQLDGKILAYFTVLRDHQAPWYPKIGMAISEDGGVSFKKLGTVLRGGDGDAWDAGGVFSPDVIAKDGKLYMLYSGISEPSIYYSGPIKIGLAISSDGITWEKHPGPVLAADQRWEGKQGVYSSSTVRVGHMFRMYFSTSNSGNPWLVGMAESEDLVRWKKSAEPCLNDPTMEEPNVFRVGEAWYMATSVVDMREDENRMSTINLYSSPDGLRWTKVGPILFTEPRSFFSERLGSAACLPLSDGRIMILFDGCSADLKRQIGRAYLKPVSSNDATSGAALDSKSANDAK
ncbi:MAG: sulfatase-like hydrolase/transferase [Thermodesulfobacteriota bacterium]